jgi:hypothetical protein
MIHTIIEFTRSAFKHGITESDIRQALLNPVYDEMQDSDDDKHLLGDNYARYDRRRIRCP